MEDQEAENIVSNFDFSDDLNSWYINYGFCQIYVVTTSSASGVRPLHGNTYVVLKGRASLEQGLEQDISDKIIPDKKYFVSACVRVSGEVHEPTTVLLELKMEDDKGSFTYLRVGMASVSTENWKKLKGSFKLHTIPRRIVFYLVGPSPELDLLVNFVTISLSNEDLPRQKVLHEKPFKRTEILVKEYEKFRMWIEDQASSSYGMVRFSEYAPSKMEAALSDSKNTLGEGGYGSVYMAVIDGRTVAIKKPKAGGARGGREFNQEVEILKRIRHPNLVTLIGACPALNALVYEFLPNGSLEDRLLQTKDKVALSWQERIKIAASICSALVFLHNTKPNPIAHGDLKPDIILFDSSNVCKLSDFGISRFLKYTIDTTTPNHDTNEVKGTASYIDPEFQQSRKLTPQSDIFAFGIILLQLVTGERALKLRDFVSNVLQNKNLKTLPLKIKERMLERLLDAKLVDPPMDEVVRMICLGLWCSEPARKNRPEESQVWVEIDSMNESVCR